MNVTNITTDDQIKYDPFLVETIVKPKDKEKVHSNRVEDNNNWDSNILKDTLSNLENNIQQSEDSSPLSYSSAPPLTSNQEASNLIENINTTDLTQSINNLFYNLNIESISKLFVEAADIKL